eukprot:2407701-Rhodomonas_salina.1
MTIQLSICTGTEASPKRHAATCAPTPITKRSDTFFWGMRVCMSFDNKASPKHFLSTYLSTHSFQPSTCIPTPQQDSQCPNRRVCRSLSGLCGEERDHQHRRHRRPCPHHWLLARLPAGPPQAPERAPRTPGGIREVLPLKAPRVWPAIRAAADVAELAGALLHQGHLPARLAGPQRAPGLAVPGGRLPPLQLLRRHVLQRGRAGRRHGRQGAPRHPPGLGAAVYGGSAAVYGGTAAVYAGTAAANAGTAAGSVYGGSAAVYGGSAAVYAGTAAANAGTAAGSANPALFQQRCLHICWQHRRFCARAARARFFP